MSDKYEIEVHPDGIHVWMTNWKGRTGLAGDFRLKMTKEEIAQELYELLAAGGSEVSFKEG